MSGQDFLPQLKKAVQAEKQYQEWLDASLAQKSVQELRKEGLVLFPVIYSNAQNSLSGTSVTFTTSYSIPDHFFKRGATVSVQAGDAEWRGRIVELNDRSLTVYSSENPELDWYADNLKISKISDDRTLQCMAIGLRICEEQALWKLIAEVREPESIQNTYTDTTFNESQRLAITAITGSDKLVAIQGPPGTGKTTTLVAGIRELVKSGKKIILAAPSNTAVDHVVRQLMRAQVPVIRVGNDEKIAADVQAVWLDNLVESGQASKSIQQYKKQLQQAISIADRNMRNYDAEARELKRAARKDIRELSQLIRKTAQDQMFQLLEQTSVIAGTPVALFNELPKNWKSDVVVIDEAAQALEPLTWLVASFGNRLVLCGDPQQLPATVLSPEAQQLKLNKSLLERIQEAKPLIRLKTQYRMDLAIQDLINGHFYDGELIAYDEAAAGLVSFIDMAGYGDGEQQDEESGSYFNESEIEVISKLIVDENLDPTNSFVLSPYSAQVKRLKEQLGKAWHVSTVDSIQGQETATVIISCTRSNESQSIGFLADLRRMNVALSRAKHRLIIIGDSATLGSNSCYTYLLDKIEQQYEYRSVWEILY
jgi:ATP-dependent RNA/DNA helicase IGHMBP2